MTATEPRNELRPLSFSRNRPQRIVLAEDERSPDRAFLNSQCLQSGDDEEIISAIHQAVFSHRERIAQ